MPPTTQTTARTLADLACRWRSTDIPRAVLSTAAWRLLDLLGGALAAHDQPGPRAARGFAREFFPAGGAGVWFGGPGLAPAGAAFANAALASALDLDDGHRGAGGHPGAAVIPAALACAQALGRGGGDFLAAVVLGYEVAVRAAAARPRAGLDTYSTGRWGGFGAAAARAWLEGSPPGVLAHALGLAGIHAPLQSASAYSRLGHHAKEGIPWGTLTGLAAVGLAGAGFTGPLDIFDHPAHFDGAAILAGWGERWAIAETYLKPYACCRWLHAALDAWRALAGEAGISPGEVRRVTVRTFARAIGLGNRPDPRTLEEAQFSLPFCLAVLAHLGPEALLPLNPALLAKPGLAAWAGQVRLVLDPALEAAFPAQAGAELAVETGRGIFSRRVIHPRGDPQNPLGEAELAAKFQTLAESRLAPARVRALRDAALAVAGGDLAGLAAELARPLEETSHVPAC